MITHKNEIIEPVKNLEQDMNRIKMCCPYWEKFSMKMNK